MLEKRGQWSRSDYRNVVILALICAVFIVLRWKKMGSLLWLDPAHWLNEISRFARGEMPYRDFSYQYPPFAVFLYGWLLRAFGISFTTVQAITDVIDLGVIACAYALIRRLLPRSLHLTIGCFLVAVCATSLMNFNLFSFVTYSPALQIGAMAVLLLLLGLIKYLDKGTLGYSGWMLIASGGFIAILSKPESALAALFVVGIFGLLVRRPWFILMIAAVVVVPAAVGYAIIANAAGPANLLAGMSAYGIATEFCPWWPTGVGTLGALASLGEAAVLAVVFALPRKRVMLTSYGRIFRYLQYAAALGIVFWASYILYQTRQALFASDIALIEKIRRIIPYFVYTTPVLEPVLWACLAVFATLAWRIILKRDASREDAVILLVSSAPVAMCSRSLFGTTQGIYPEVAGICYPFLLVLGPYLLWRFLKPAGNSYAVILVSMLAVIYAVIRVAGGWSDMLSDRNYGTLHTEAGTVKLLNYDTDSKVYAFVMSHTSAGDYVLDLPYGGGLNFASGRPDPIFNVQLYGLGVPRHYEQLDLDLIQSHPPRVIIGQDEPNLGTYWGYGNRGNRACPCPRLVWAPNRASWDPNHVLPVAKFIEEHYTAVEKIGNKVIWLPKY